MNDRTYLVVSGVLFALMSLAQLARLVFRLPVEVAGFPVPLWASVVALVVLLSLCVWAFRLSGRSSA